MADNVLFKYQVVLNVKSFRKYFEVRIGSIDFLSPLQIFFYPFSPDNEVIMRVIITLSPYSDNFDFLDKSGEYMCWFINGRWKGDTMAINLHPHLHVLACERLFRGRADKSVVRLCWGLAFVWELFLDRWNFEPKTLWCFFLSFAQQIHGAVENIVICNVH